MGVFSRSLPTITAEKGAYMSKRSRRLLSVAVILAVLIVITLIIANYLERAGNTFFDRGKQVVDTLEALGKKVQARDISGIESFYSASFRGSSLGLGKIKQIEEKDGIRQLAMASGGDLPNRAAALDEWKEYLSGFDLIEEVGIHVHRMKEWQSDKERIAEVRFELIGTPKGAPQAGIDRAYFRMRFDVAPEGLKIRETSLIEGDRSISDKPQFTNVAHEAGIDFMNQYYPRFLSDDLKFKMIRYGPGGISAVDYDNDGFYDLFIPDGVESRLFHNNGDGTFTDVTAQAGLSGLDGASVGVFADYDNDGYKDLFVSRTFKHNQLFHNNGNGTFTDVTAKSGIGEDCCTTVASWGDYDNDGFVDLYVGRYLDPRLAIPTTFYARNGEPNQLYHNNGDGTFTNVTEKAGVGEKGLCLGTVWGDYDDDGYLDLYVVNDFGRKTLYHNNRDGTFTDVTVKSHTLAYGAGMSASFGDYDNDGRLDIYVANIRSEHAWYADWPTVGRYMVNTFKQGVWQSDMPLYFEVFKQSGFGYVEVFQQMANGNDLFHNNGDGTFTDHAWETNTNPLGWFWGSGFADFDNDGWQDIYSVNGWVYNDRGTEIELDFLNNVVSHQDLYKTGILFDPKHFGRTSWHGWERNRHLRNNGNGRKFTEIGRAAGTDLLLNSRGIAVADYWNRGALDIAVYASTDRHALLKNEVGTRRNWLAVETVGTKSNRDGIGTRITITIGGKLQMREVVCGDGYGSQNSLRMYFGLNDAQSVDELTVRWPRSGIVQKFKNVAGNRIVEVTEGKDQLVEKHYEKKEQGGAK
jgi:hypothetical protein